MHVKARITCSLVALVLGSGCAGAGTQQPAIRSRVPMKWMRSCSQARRNKHNQQEAGLGDENARLVADPGITEFPVRGLPY